MSDFAATRTGFLARYGRQMALRRPVGSTSASFTTVAVQGFYALYAPEQVGLGGILQGDAQVQICATEIAASSLAAPRVNDQLVIDNRTWKILGVYPVNDGPTVIGYSLWIRGG